ncbi:hypothetical protein WME73_35755 [Sorangium sp. So ce302]|uniref:hypothetical protein n=1 Tax=Sorangium sp. So ce302 TaxID=3133297 RepID=UPI003F614F14
MEKLEATDLGDDAIHDLAHITRMVATAEALAADEAVRLDVVVSAAWLHDLVNVPKNDPRRSQASRLCAEAALAFLQRIDYPEELLDDIPTPSRPTARVQRGRTVGPVMSRAHHRGRRGGGGRPVGPHRSRPRRRNRRKP